MSKPILIIDPGHGGKDPGGGSSIFWDSGGFYERDMVLKISLYQYERFRQLGMPVALTRDRDVTLDPGSRTDKVKASGAKYCISNHINAAGATSARGVETIHSIHSDGKLATALFRAIVDAGMPGRRVFCKSNSSGGDYYFMHRNTGAVSTVIVEYGFATNAEDSRLLKQNWQVYAEAVVKAFCLFINQSYTPPEGEDDKPMTQKERDALDALLRRTNKLEEDYAALKKLYEASEKQRSMPCPDWARPAIEAAQRTIGPDGNPIVIEADGGSYDFYRIISVMHRAGLIK